MNWKRPYRSLTIRPRKAAHCPECAAEIAGAMECGPQAPKAGGFTICWQCKEFLRFNPDLQLRKLTAEDKRTLDKNPATVAELEQLRIQIAVKGSR
jgi:hypothetical protein